MLKKRWILLLMFLVLLAFMAVKAFEAFSYTPLYEDVANRGCRYEGERIFNGTEVAPKIERVLVSEYDAQEYLNEARRQGRCISNYKYVYSD